MRGRILPALALVIIVSGPAFAQLAVETAPGVRSYGGNTMSVETMPGYHRFSGVVEGSAVQIAPGLSYYNLRPSIDTELEQNFAAESQWRAQSGAAWDRAREQEHARDRQMIGGIRNYGR
jgi:hypothetical protein